MFKERCHKCNLAAGASIPPGSELVYVTLYYGTCEDCEQKTTIVPAEDYDWSKEARKTWFD